MSWLRKDVGLKLVSLLISVTLWAYVRSITLDNERRTIDFKLYETGLDHSKFVVTHMPDTVKVTANGSPEELTRLDKLFKTSQFIGYVDLTNAEPGTAAYRVNLQTNGIRDAGISYTRPDRVLVSIEPVDTITKKVYFIPVDPPSGYGEGLVEITPDSVVLSGPRSDLSRVDRVKAPVDLRNYLANPGDSYTVDVIPVDRSEKRVDSVTAEPSKVKVYPVLVQTQKQKNVPIELNWKGNLPFGYILQSHEVIPQQVTINGDPDRIKSVETIQTDPIDLSNVTGYREVRVKLRIPQYANLSRRAPHDVRVRLDVIPDPNLQPAKPKEPSPSASEH